MEKYVMSLLVNIASVAGFFLGIVYAIGLIIVTLHLNRYGIASVNLVQARYLVVGFVYLLLVLGAAMFTSVPALLLVFFVSLNSSTYIVMPLGLLSLVSLLLASVFPTAFGIRVQRKYGAKNNQIVYWRYWHITLFLSVLMLWLVLARSILLGDLFSKIAFVLLLIAILFTGIIYYTIFLYQSPILVGNPILELIGSGQPIKVRISIAKNALSGFRKYGILDSKEEISEPLFLLDETSDEFIVLTNFEGKERAIKINKSVVTSIIYLP
jgi:hypothetical protein